MYGILSKRACFSQKAEKRTQKKPKAFLATKSKQSGNYTTLIINRLNYLTVFIPQHNIFSKKEFSA